MADYIKREAAKRLFADSHDYGLARKLDAIPAADVMEVKRGRWEDIGNDWFDLWRCSACGAEWSFPYDPTSTETRVNFCPDCGARMDGAADKNVGHTIPVNDLYDEDGGDVMKEKEPEA